jgi:hypothetical protein
MSPHEIGVLSASILSNPRPFNADISVVTSADVTLKPPVADALIPPKTQMPNQAAGAA